MPNWVYNSMSVSGTKEDLTAFRDKASKQHTTLFIGVRSKNEKGEWVYDDTAVDEHLNDEPLSFWNFIKPADEILPIYFGHEKEPNPDGFDSWSADEKFAHQMKHGGNDSYNWNVRNWGVKWDAGDVSFEEDFTEGLGGSLSYNFQTAWGIPEPVFRAMVEQHPTLAFEFESEEEQGWGAAFESRETDGLPELALVREWDIPDCHQDYVDRDEVDRCNCESDPDDQEYWYDDCPRPETDFVVVVERRYIVKAKTAENAWEITQDTLDELTPEDADTIWVIDEGTGERLFPKLEESET
jgi:hypothetical protein